MLYVKLLEDICYELEGQEGLNTNGDKKGYYGGMNDDSTIIDEPMGMITDTEIVMSPDSEGPSEAKIGNISWINRTCGSQTSQDYGRKSFVKIPAANHDVTSLLILRAGDVESNPGPKRERASTNSDDENEFDGILKEIARSIPENNIIDDLGKALGFTVEDINRYIKTNNLHNQVTYDGTLEMLRKWRKGKTRTDERGALKEALIHAGQVHTADKFLPTEKPGISADPRQTSLTDEMLDQVVDDIKRYYIMDLCSIQADPLNNETIFKFGDIFTNLTLIEVDELTMGVKSKTPLPYGELLKTKVSGLLAKRLLVEGEGGAGKTTFCSKIAFDWAQGTAFKQFKIVAVVLLRKAKNKTIGEIVKTYLSDSNPVTAGQINQYILANPEKVFLVLDGLDEFDGDFSGDDQIIQIILNKVFMSGVVLVTTRQWKVHLIRGNTDLKKVYAFIVVEGFSAENQSLYIEKFFAHDYSSSSEDLIRFIGENDVIRENMAPFPIYTAMLCIMWKEYDGERRKAMKKLKTFSLLLDEMVSFLVDHYLPKVGLLSEEEMEDRRTHISNHLELIGEIAFKGLLERRLVFPEDTYRSCKESMEVGWKVGVLTREKHARTRRERRRKSELEVSTVQFPHKLFQEYLSAMHLASVNSKNQSSYEKLMDDIIGKAEEFRYLLYFTSAKTEKLGLDIVGRLMKPNTSQEELIVDVAYESQHESVAKAVGNHLETISNKLDIGKGMSSHTVSGHLFAMEHRSALEELILSKSCGHSASQELAEFICSFGSLSSLKIGDIVGSLLTLDEVFYSVIAEKSAHSKIKNLHITYTDMSELPEPSSHLARFICHMSHLRNLEFCNCQFHEDFYKTTESVGSSAKIENLRLALTDYSQQSAASRYLANFICQLSHLKNLEFDRCQLHEIFYRTAEELGSSAKIENLKLVQTDLSEQSAASSHLAKFICQKSHLKSLECHSSQLHEDFFKVAESFGSSAKIENIKMYRTDLSERSSSSCYFAKFICTTPHLKSLEFRDTKFHEDFYETVESLGSSAKIENLKLLTTDLSEYAATSSHLAKFICQMSHLKSLEFDRCQLHADFFQSSDSAGLSLQTDDHSGIPRIFLRELIVDGVFLSRWHPRGAIFDRLSVESVTLKVWYDLNTDLIERMHGLHGVKRLVVQSSFPDNPTMLDGEPFSIVQALLRAFPQLINFTCSDILIGNAGAELILEYLRETDNLNLMSFRLLRCDTTEELDALVSGRENAVHLAVEHGRLT